MHVIPLFAMCDVPCLGMFDTRIPWRNHLVSNLCIGVSQVAHLSQALNDRTTCKRFLDVYFV